MTVVLCKCCEECARAVDVVDVSYTPAWLYWLLAGLLIFTVIALFVVRHKVLYGW